MSAGATLLRRLQRPASPFLVYTSAGDNANVDRWLRGTRTFDLWITHYGNRPGRHSAIADYYNERQGGKFPNLLDAFRRWGELFRAYEYVLIADDDIDISGTRISHMFKLCKSRGLVLAQPAFDPRGKVSHLVTQARPFSLGRHVNFVEVTCPVMRSDALEKFLAVFDPTLVGWGIDWWYMEVLKDSVSDKVAVIDAIRCINPDATLHGRPREIEVLQPTPVRIANWNKIKRLHGISSEDAGARSHGALRPRNLFELFLFVTAIARHTYVFAVLTQHRIENRINRLISRIHRQ